MAHSVFISYSSKDTDVAESICAYLEASDIPCWIAPRNIPAGQINWEGVIVKGIRQSEAFLLLFNENSNRSGQVMREVRAAFDLELPVILVRTEAITPSDDLAYYLKGVQWFNAFSTPVENDFPKLLATVNRVLAKQDGVTGTDEERQAMRHQMSVGRKRTRLVATLAAVTVAVSAGFAVVLRQPAESHPTLAELRVQETEIEGSLAKTMVEEKSGANKSADTKAELQKRQAKLLEDLGSLIKESQHEGYEAYAILWSARHLVLSAQFKTGALTFNQAISQATGKLRVAWQLASSANDPVLEAEIQQTSRTLLRISNNASEPQPTQIQQEIAETLTAIVKGKR